MSADHNLSASPRLPRLAHSPQSPSLPYFEDPPDEDSYDQQQAEAAIDDDEIPYPEPGSEQTLLPPPNFNPFFTVIEDTTSGEHYHPYVHYVFADDDPIVVTAASIRSLGMDETRYLPQQMPDEEMGRDVQHGQVEDEEDAPAESPLLPPIPGVKEHYLIIDVATDGRSVVDAQSLSPTWQIIDTTVRTAPSFDENSPHQGYMLRIEGVGISNKSKAKGKAKAKGQTGQDKLSEAMEKNQGDILGALDRLMLGVQEGLEVAAKISEPRRIAAILGEEVPES